MKVFDIEDQIFAPVNSRVVSETLSFLGSGITLRLDKGLVAGFDRIAEIKRSHATMLCGGLARYVEFRLENFKIFGSDWGISSADPEFGFGVLEKASGCVNFNFGGKRTRLIVRILKRDCRLLVT